MQKRLFLIDGTALAYRSFFAFAGSRMSLSNSTGHPTSATFGFVQTLRSLLEREKPDAIAVAFDGAREDLCRTSIYPEYKSTRNKMPDEMLVQLDDIRELVEGYGIRIVESQTDEADDVIGTLAVQARAAGLEVFIVTGDKDFMQIVDDRIKLWNLRSSTTKPEILGPDEVRQKFGVPPERIVDLLALMGDTSDNVPGVPKIGEKTAAELIAQFGSLDELLARTDEVQKNAVRASLQQHRDQALLSRQLVTLRLDVPLPVQVGQIGPAAPDSGRLRALFTRLEFESLLKTLKNEVADDVVKDYCIVRTGAELDALLAGLRDAPAFAFDVETTGRALHQADVVGISFCAAPGRAAYVPLNLQPPLLPGGRDAVLSALRPLLEDGARGKIGHDTKLAIGMLRRAGIEVQGVQFDAMLASYCSNPGTASHDLDALTQRHFGFTKVAAKTLVGTGKMQKTFDQVDVGLVGNLACEDADYTFRLRDVLQRELDEQDVAAIFRDLEMPLVPVLLDMEWEGIGIDRDHLAGLSRELHARADELQRRIHQRAGSEFNLNSPAQVGKVLFDDLEVHRAADLKPKKTPGGQWKTDADVLERLAPHHEVPQMLLEWRLLTKLLGTYVDSLPQMVDPGTGRIHTSFNQAVAATGRLSSDNPNLQNIPIRTKEGQQVRKAFVSRAKDWVLLSADYSQIELRIMAHLSGDRALLESFRRGEDIHRRTAALVHGLLPDLVTPELRNQAKAINYGLMYGMGASRLANETGLTLGEARKFIEAYFRALPGVKKYLDGSLQQARTRKEVWTMFGRRRPLPEIDSTNAMQRIAAENMAVNTPIQGAAADIVKRAMLKVHAALRRQRLRTRLLLQVHDELVFDVPQDELPEAQALIREAMSTAAELAVPLEVQMGHGRNWLEAH